MVEVCGLKKIALYCSLNKEMLHCAYIEIGQCKKEELDEDMVRQLVQVETNYRETCFATGPPLFMED